MNLITVAVFLKNIFYEAFLLFNLCHCGLSQIYDMYIKFDTSSSFYYHYSEPSSTSLYKSDYRYVDYVEGWLKNK